MNPYESPIAVSETASTKLPWKKLLLLGFGLLFGAALILPALMPARGSRFCQIRDQQDLETSSESSTASNCQGYTSESEPEFGSEESK